MEIVICSCIKCKSELGCFRNAWNKIGNTYFSPIYPLTPTLDGFVATSSIYKGSEQTQIENSYLQDIACKACGVVLGLRCDSAPEGHMLKRNQLILRLAEMSVVSERTGRNAAPSIIERFPLTLPGVAQQPRCGRASTVQPNGAATVGLINHRHAASSLLSPLAGEKQQRELEIFQDWAKSAIQTQRDDLCRIGGAVDRLERELKDVKDFMGNVRAELTTYRQFQESIKNKELRDIRQGLDVIQAELNTNRQFKNSLRENEFPVLQEDIDVLRSELAKAQEFQQELKHQHFRTLQQDVDALRRNVEGLAYLSEDDYRASIEKFEKRMNEVYEVVPKADEVNILRTEFVQLKARLAFIESSVRGASATQQTIAQTPHMSEKAPGAILQNHIGVPGPETSWLSKRSDLRVVDPSSYEHEHGQAKSLLKRKHFEAKSKNDKSYSPPAKRQMTSTGQAASINSKNDASKFLTVRFQAEYSPIIVSSNHGTPSPLLGRYSDNNTGNEDNVLNRSNDESMTSNNLPQKPLCTGDVLSSRPKLPTGRSNGVSRGTIDISMGKPSMNTYPKRTSLNRAQKSAEMSHKSVRVTTTNENQKYGSIRERSDTPDQLSTLSADEAMQKSVQKRRSGCVNGQGRNTFSGNIIETIDSDSPLPSVEGDTVQRATKVSVIAQALPAPPPVAIVDANAERPFTCRVCGKTYKFAANLERHKVIANRCREDVGLGRSGNAQEETVKKRRVREREHLAAELLARP